ncbi:MAG: hypothetical protein M1470_04100 [Bacteroidetes bacterium]|nr:hypothetical protein [Bacteroidota bacterium]
MDLFQSRVNADGSYVGLRDDPKQAKHRAFINGLYNDVFAAYADRDFPEKFPIECVSRFWELYLGSALIKTGFTLVPRSERPTQGPDFCVLEQGAHIWVEAVTPRIGDGADSQVIGEKLKAGVFQRVPTDEIVLRYTSDISAKYKNHLKHISKGLVADQDPFILAINGGAMPIQFRDDIYTDEIPYAIQAVLPFGHYAMTIDPNTHETIKEGFQHRDQIPKVNGAPVPTNTFLDPSFSLISALLFASADPLSTDTLTPDTLSMLRNGSCKHCLPDSWYKVGVQWSLSQQENEYVLQRIQSC